MLITKNLPIDSNKFAQQDQILTITGATWQDYQKFDAEEYPQGEGTRELPSHVNDTSRETRTKKEIKFLLLPSAL